MRGEEGAPSPWVWVRLSAPMGLELWSQLPHGGGLVPLCSGGPPPAMPTFVPGQEAGIRVG